VPTLATAHPMAVRLAGYQGPASILSASLQDLARGLRDPRLVFDVQVEEDVTASGEKAADLFASVESGQRHVAYMASGYLSARVPALGVLDLPFSVSDRTTALAALDSEAGAQLREAVSRQTGLQVLAFWDNGFRHISNSVRPLRTPSDCAGLVIRTLDSALYRELLTALGFTAVTTDVKDLVPAVRSGAVQAQENPLTNLLSFGLWQYHPHVSLTGHSFGVLLLVCPRDWYVALPQAQRSVLDAAVAQATAAQRKRAAAQDKLALAALREHGVRPLMPADLDLAAMHAATAPITARLCRQLSTDLIQAYLPHTLH
jgi:TRAP-type transport system periplasmic protein